MALFTRRPASLHRVPLAAVPRLRRYYQDAMTPCLASLRLIVFALRYHAAAARSCSRFRAPRAPRLPTARGQGVLFTRTPSLPGFIAWTKQGLPGSLASLPAASLPFSDPGRPSAPCPSRRFGAAPSTGTLKASSLRLSRLYSGALLPAVYASRRALPRAMQNSLPAD